MAWRILIVDDEPALQSMVGEILTQAGYETESAFCCAQAVERFRTAVPDAVLLDVMLPDGDGFSLLGTLRELRDVPVLFLSARDEDEARLKGLGLGADDYITKPFLPQELLLRLRAVLRRVYRETPAVPRLGRTEIDWGKGTVRREGRETALTAKEFALLNKLWEARGNIGTIGALCAALWDGPLGGYENTLMVHIRRLREKLEEDPRTRAFCSRCAGWATGSNGRIYNEAEQLDEGGHAGNGIGPSDFCDYDVGRSCLHLEYFGRGYGMERPHPDHIRFAGF